MIIIRYWKEFQRGAIISFMKIANSLNTDQNLKKKIISRMTTNLIKKYFDFLGINYYLNNSIVEKVEETHVK